MTPAFLLRLMHYTALSRGFKLGPEDLIAGHFTADLRKATLEGRLRAVWCHVPNELARNTTASALARALGLIPGTADYLFLASDKSAALECKAAKGKMSPYQSDFEAWCVANGVPYYVFRTPEEGLEILRREGLLI